MIINGRISRKYYGSVTEEQMPPPPTHCNCGRVLVRHFENDGYMPNGDKVQVLTWRCPITINWWNRASLRFLTHDEYEPMNFFDWYWKLRHYQ